MSTRGTQHWMRRKLLVSSLAGLALVCTLERPASAAVGVLKVKTGFNEDAGEIYTPYILASDYSIRRTWGNGCSTGWETVLPDLGGTTDIAVPGDICVIWGWGGAGPVWCYDEWGGGWGYYPEPSGATFTKLAAAAGRLYAMTASGVIYRYSWGDLWQPQGWITYSSAQGVEIAAHIEEMDEVFFLAPPAAGSVYTPKMVPYENGPITSYGSPRGTKIAVDNNNRPWVASNSGTIYRWDGTRWRSSWLAGMVYEMDINQQSNRLHILSDPAVGTGHTLWTHDLVSGGWSKCPVP